MNKYETIIIISSRLTQEQTNAVISKVEKYINENGNIINTDDKGIRKLAYNIKEHNEGHYYLIEFESKEDSISELERLYRITDEILKFIVIRKD